MFKLVVLFAICALASAHPGYLDHHEPLVYSAPLIQETEYVKYDEPIVTKVGDVVQSIPTAVSHQSQSIVHSQAHIVKPILAKSVRTHITPVIKTYAAAPVYKTYSAPLYQSYAAPSIYGYGHGHGHGHEYGHGFGHGYGHGYGHGFGHGYGHELGHGYYNL